MTHTTGTTVPGLRSWQLFAICVAVWGTSWHVITWQLGSGTPELGVAMRFGLASVLVLAWCAWRGEAFGFGLREHGLFALQGVFMYSLSYVCVYHAETHVPSGLVAVGYSASPLINGLAARVLWGVPVRRRFLAGGVLGMAGVTLIFLPEFARTDMSQGVVLGTLFTVAAVLLSSVGSLAASRNRSSGLALWPALGWGMFYGALASALVLTLSGSATGRPIGPPSPLADPAWWLALVYLAVAASVVTFAAFLTLQDRIGPGPSSAVGVAAPVVAISMSIAFESYQPGWETMVGMALAVLGNIWMLHPGRGWRAAPMRSG